MLMRVLAVAHFLRLAELQVDGAWQFDHATVLLHPTKIVGDHAVVIRCVFKRFYRQVETCGIADHAFVAVQFFQHARVVNRVNDDADISVVFRRGANHRRAADVDVFNRVFQRAAFFGNRGFERVEVDHDQIDRRDVIFLHHAIVDTAST